MSRLLFGSSLVFENQGSGFPLISKSGVTVGIYTDAGATSLASITDTGGAAVAGSLLTADGHSLLPAFYGPTGAVNILYAKPTGTTTIIPLYANGSSSGQLLGTASRTSNYAVTTNGTIQLIPDASITFATTDRPAIIVGGGQVAHNTVQGANGAGVLLIKSGTDQIDGHNTDHRVANLIQKAAIFTPIPAGQASATYQLALYAATAGTMTAYGSADIPFTLSAFTV